MKKHHVAIEFMTAGGLKTVRSWGYLLQGSSHEGGTAALKVADLANAAHDLIVSAPAARPTGRASDSCRQASCI